MLYALLQGIICSYADILLFQHVPMQVLPQLVQTFADMSATAPRGRGAVQPFKMRPFPRDWLVAAIAPTGLLLNDVDRSADIRSLQVNYSRHKVRLYRTVGTQSSIESHSSSRERVSVPAIADPLATAALAVYYILCREQIFRSMGIDGGLHGWHASQSDAGEEGNWTNLLACLPLRPLIKHMEEHWLSYENLLPQVAIYEFCTLGGPFVKILPVYLLDTFLERI